MTRTMKISLGKIDCLKDTRHWTKRARKANEVTLELNIKTKTRETRTIDLVPIQEYRVLTMSGSVWNHLKTDIYQGGQCLDYILELFPKNKRLQRIVEIWKEWHLNDMNAGTRKQKQFLDINLQGKYDYSKAVALLKKHSLLIDREYEYGCGWLVKPLPIQISMEALRLFSSFPQTDKA